MIEDLAKARSLTCFDAIIEYCEESGAEIEICATLLTQNLKARITEEVESMNLLKSTNKLPF